MTQMDSWTIVGTLASLAGLGIGLYVLSVAKGARRAAKAARVLARKRNLAEELEDASKKVEQVGDFLNKREWMAVRIRAHEIMTSCKESMTRWPDGLSAPRKNDVLTASTLLRSIAEQASSPTVNEFGSGKLKRLSETQLEAAGLLSNALGEARNSVERDGE